MLVFILLCAIAHNNKLLKILKRSYFAMFNLRHISAGFTAVLVGYTSSAVLIIQAANAAGATPAQLESWLFALAISMGVSSILFSYIYKMPILTAWSTPGAAFLITSSSQYQMATLIGAFAVTGLLIVLTGLLKPFRVLLRQIPPVLSTAMLAAILLPFCLASFETISTEPIIFGVMFLVFVLAKRFVPNYTMLLLLISAVVLTIYVNTSSEVEPIALGLSQAEFMAPEFELSAILNISIPLYLITMLSQNLPGLAVLSSHQYQAPVKSILIGTGGLNTIAAPFGGFSVNLAAITAAICMTEEVDKNKDNRYQAAIWGGVFYLIAGLFATSIVALFMMFPPEVTKILAGLALLGTLMMCLTASLQDTHYREAALLTFLVTLSGASIFGINSILLGLAIGLVYSKVIEGR